VNLDSPRSYPPKRLSKGEEHPDGMQLMRRHGFVVSPRLVFPALLIVVLVMFFVFAPLDSQGVSAARILGTVIVGAVIIVLFLILAILSRVRRGKDTVE
jgi:hypothetical protein